MAAPALATLTTMRVGGSPERLIECKTTDDLIAVAQAIWDDEDPWLLLGGGSNTVASDEGFAGTVLRIATSGIRRIDAPDGRVRLRIEAGEPWDGVVEHAVQNGWSGIEALSGIPGSVGAAPVQNIGAYGQELASALVAIDFLDFESGERCSLSASDLQLGYRRSALKRGRLGIVLSVDLELADGGRDALSAPIGYAQLASALGTSVGERMPLARVREAVLALRASKGMLLDEADPDSVSAGSFFTNPIVRETFARTLPPEAPRWPLARAEDAPTIIPLDELHTEVNLPAVLPEGIVPPALQAAGAVAQATDTTPSVKLSAAWLIEHAGIHRGFALPGSHAAISSKHTLAITNRGGATAEDVAELARYVRNRVASDFGVVLQPEPTLVGLYL